MTPALSAHFPIEVDSVRIDVLEAAPTDDALCITVQLVVLDDAGGVLDLKEQEVRVPADADATALAARVRERLSDPDFDPTTSMPADLFEERVPFRRVQAPPSDAPDWTQAVAIAVQSQAEEAGFAARFDRVRHWPIEARTVYFLWIAETQLGGNGIGVFLAQQDVADVVGVLEALVGSGCVGLAERYRQGLGLADRQRSSEFLCCVDEDWLAENALEPPSAASSETDAWKAIDSQEEGGTYALIRSELRAAFTRYVRAHADALLLPR